MGALFSTAICSGPEPSFSQPMTTEGMLWPSMFAGAGDAFAVVTAQAVRAARRPTTLVLRLAEVEVGKSCVTRGPKLVVLLLFLFVYGDAEGWYAGVISDA
jgi:hypothetical protein